MSDFKVGVDKEDEVAYLCYKGEPCSYLGSFLTVWVNDEETVKSPISNIDDAVVFVEIIKKLLEVIHNDGLE